MIKRSNKNNPIFKRKIIYLNSFFTWKKLLKKLKCTKNYFFILKMNLTYC